MTKHEITYVVIIILLSVVTIIALVRGYRTKRVGTLIPIIER